MSPLLSVLQSLLSRFENELVEFKTADSNYDFEKIGKYFSAISNEANLREQQFGWLIFGVNDQKQIVGTQFRDSEGLNHLKQEIALHTGSGISFVDIFEVYPETASGTKRVIMFKIPAALAANPTAWKNHYYARQGESLVPLSLDKLERIRFQSHKDWSKILIAGSGIQHLDPGAISLARTLYKQKLNKSHVIHEVDLMDDETFLTKIRLMKDGLVSHAAMVLLGNPEFSHLLDRPPSVMWRLYSGSGQDRDYEIFEIPFLMVGDRVYNKIRNLTYRYMPNQRTLFPMETLQYEQATFYELLNNCFAHQDYSMGARTYIDEFEDRLIFTNPGTFIPQTIRAVLDPSYAPPFYRNQLLAETMMNLGMIDTASMGIRNIYEIQRRKYFPMPDYIVLPNQVKVTLYGKVLNLDFSQILFDSPNIDLETIFLLDQVQKGEELTEEEIRFLRKENLIEGKKSHLILASNLAEQLGTQAEYIKRKGFDDQYYKDLIISFLMEFQKASRDQLRDLLFTKFPEGLTPKQQENKLKNLLTSMSKQELIKSDSENKQKSHWILTGKGLEKTKKNQEKPRKTKKCSEKTRSNPQTGQNKVMKYRTFYHSVSLIYKIVAVGLFLFFALSILRFNPADEFNTNIRPNIPVTNWCGETGASLAAWCFAFFGWGVYFTVYAAGFHLARFLFDFRSNYYALRFTGFCLFQIAICGFISLLFCSSSPIYGSSGFSEYYSTPLIYSHGGVLGVAWASFFGLGGVFCGFMGLLCLALFGLFLYSDFTVPYFLYQICTLFHLPQSNGLFRTIEYCMSSRSGWQFAFTQASNKNGNQAAVSGEQTFPLEPGVVKNDVDGDLPQTSNLNEEDEKKGEQASSTENSDQEKKEETVEIADPDTVPPVLQTEEERRARRAKLAEAVDGYEIDETVTAPRNLLSSDGSMGGQAPEKPRIHHPETAPVNLTDSTGGFSQAKTDAIDSGNVEDVKEEMNAGVSVIPNPDSTGDGIELLEQHPADEPEYEFPSLDLLDPVENFDYSVFEAEAARRASDLERYIKEFGFTVTTREIQLGPTITQYQVEPEQGLRVIKIASLADDLAVKLGVSNVRIVYPLLGKQNLVGIEIPNVKKQLVRMREVMEQLEGSYSKMSIPVFLGKDVAGKPLMADLATLPHLLIAGRTGTGKSVCLNSIITSIIMTRSPKDVRMLMVDPKMVEMSQYREIPHLMHPVVTDMKKAEAILAWAVEKMEDRYRWLARAGVRHIKDYNKMDHEVKVRRVKPKPDETMPESMPFIVIVVDEMADLMMTAPKDVESHIIRLAQKSRAVGIHLILATQKPIVSVITSLIKSNLPARIAFQVSSKTDSRVVLDENGADRLLGHGDMLFLLPGTSTLIRAQGTYLSDDEIYRVVATVATGEPQFEDEIEQHIGASGGGKLAEWAKRDELYTSAIEIIVNERRGSISLLQRMLGIGYGRSARLIDFMEEDGIVGTFKGYTKPREVLLKKEDWEAMKAEFEKEQGSAIQAEIERARAEAAMKEIEKREAALMDEEEEPNDEWNDESDEDFDEETADDEDLFREESVDEGKIPPWNEFDESEQKLYPLPTRPVERSQGRSRRRITPNYEKIRAREAIQESESQTEPNAQTEPVSQPEKAPEPEDLVNSPESQDVLSRIQPNQPKPFTQDGPDHFREIK